MRPLVVAAVAVAVAAGIGARFVQLDRTFWYHDEATTSLRISGFESGDFLEAAGGRLVTSADLQKFQHVNGERGTADSLRSLADDDPQHPPAFYVLARLWAVAVGDSIASLRTLAALLGLLVLAAVFWLAGELFGRSRTRWIAVALTALSPIQVLYARDAREYALWAAAAVAAGAALLRALRVDTTAAWVAYAGLAALALLTYPLTVLVVAGHVAYVVAAERPRLRRVAAAAAAAAVPFLPWVYVTLRNRSSFAAGTDWTTTAIGHATLLRNWLVEAGLPLVDNATLMQRASAVSLLVGIAAAGLCGVAFVRLLVVGRRREAGFLAATAGALFVPLALADVTSGGLRSTVPRFLIPSLTLLLLPVADAIAAPGRILAGAAGRLALCAAVVAGAAWSYTRSLDARVWWTHDDGAAAENAAVADLLSRHPGWTLVSTGGGNVLELIHYLRPSTRILVAEPLPSRLPVGRRPTLLYGSPAGGGAAARLDALVARLRSTGRARLEPLSPRLPCCGGGIAAAPRQLWLVTPSR